MAFLENACNQEEAQLIILYGRRRVGKTELVVHFAKNRPHIYYLATETSEKDNLENLFKKLRDFYQDDILSYERTWDNLFKYLGSKKERLILIIDEFPYIISQNKATSSLFQKGWDLYLKNSKIFLVLAGSSIGMMETHTLDYKAPLYGRRTGQWKLQPLKFKDVAAFFPKYSAQDIVAVYGILDAIPAYLAQFNPERDVWENIHEKVLRKGMFLFEEIDFLLKAELREPKVYKGILKSIAMGYTKFGEIMNAAGVDKSKLSVYLDTLGTLHLIEKRIPVLDNARSKKGRYYIRDNFFKFWFRYVLPNRSFLEEGKIEPVLKTIQKDFAHYVGRFVFEDICREWLRQTGASFTANKLGSHWGTVTKKGQSQSFEIDIVGVDDASNKILFGECKWSSNVDARKVLNQLKQKASYLSWHSRDRMEYYILFAKSFLSKQLPEKDVRLIDLDSLH